MFVLFGPMHKGKLLGQTVCPTKAAKHYYYRRKSAQIKNHFMLLSSIGVTSTRLTNLVDEISFNKKINKSCVYIVLLIEWWQVELTRVVLGDDILRE